MLPSDGFDNLRLALLLCFFLQLCSMLFYSILVLSRFGDSA